MKKVLILLASIFIVAGAVVVYFLLSPKPIETSTASENFASTEESEKKSVSQDPQVLEALQRIGYKGDISDLSLFHVSEAAVAEKCEWTEAAGCFVEGIFEPHEIYVANVPNREDYDLIAAHEFLHYIYVTEKLSDNNQLIEALYTLRNENPYLEERIVAEYQEGSFDISTEIFSYGCTELSSEALGVYLDSFCNLYIDTTKLPDLA